MRTLNVVSDHFVNLWEINILKKQMNSKFHFKEENCEKMIKVYLYIDIFKVNGYIMEILLYQK